MTSKWQQNFIELLLPTAYAWRRAASASFGVLDLTASTGGPLLIIRRLGNGISQGDIAREAGIDHAAVVRVLNQMECNGLIARRAAADDRRRNGVYLTEKGEDLAARLETVFEQFRDSCLEGVSAEHGRIATQVLRTVLERSLTLLEHGGDPPTSSKK